jgi:outer membrane biosynthesis protein TonB
MTGSVIAPLALYALLVASPGIAQVAAKPSACEQEARKRYGRSYTVGRRAKDVRVPRKVHGVHPTYPAVPPGSTVKLGGWLVEALIAPTGIVTDVWVLREVRFTPPFPEFTQAAAAAVRQWRYEPPMANGQAIPVCMKVSGNINWP